MSFEFGCKLRDLLWASLRFLSGVLGHWGFLVQLFHFRLDKCFTLGIRPRKWIEPVALNFLPVTPRIQQVIRFQHYISATHL